MTYVFRNNTIERFFRGNFQFSGYDDFSAVPQADEYVWWYQVPIKYNVEQLIAEVETYKNKLEWIVEQIGNNPMQILTLECVYYPKINISDQRLESVIRQFNDFAWALEKEKSNVKVIDFSIFLNQFSEEEWIDWKFYFMSQMIINPRLSAKFIEWYAEQLRIIQLKRKKCLVLDLDNTLWGGVLGEDGVSGIRIDGDYPGKAYHYWQESIKELAQKGVILAICSKNNKSDVEELFSVRSMPLSLTDFVVAKINWDDKATNLKSIADELNIGLDSIVFIDDNPSERELIKQQLPMVAVPDWPHQPYELPIFYEKLVNQYFAVYSLTNEDVKKTEQYRQNASRKQLQMQYTNIEDFLKSLEMQLTIKPASELSIPRIAQMTQKTNQFNLTTRRYSEADINKLLSDNARIYTLSVSDRFGDNGITGLIIITKDAEIDTLLLSCRILGKGIEFAFVREVLKTIGVKTLSATYIPTDKNIQVSDFYDRVGFTLQSEDINGKKKYIADTENLDLSIKEYYQILK